MVAPRVDGLDIHGRYQPLVDHGRDVPQYRLMSVKATEGATSVAHQARDYFAWFRARRFEHRGVYHWLRSDSTAKAQVDNLARFLATMGGLQQGEFVQLDWETTPDIPAPSLALVEEWINLAEHHWQGRIIVYASDWVPHFAEWRKRHPGYPLWYANYNTGPSASGGWAECAKFSADLWQWTSSATVPGIATRCDANHVFDWARLRRLAGYDDAPRPPAPQPEPGPTPPEEPDDMPKVITRTKGQANAFLLNGLHLTPELVKHLTEVEGYVIVTSEPHDQHTRSLLHAAGLTAADLVSIGET